MAGVHQMMLHRAASGSAFPTYWVITQGSPGGVNNRKVNKNNSISTLAADANAGATTLYGGSLSTARRLGAILARGNVILVDDYVSTNGGTTFTLSFQESINTTFPMSSGRNGSFAYKDSLNMFATPFTRGDKSGNWETGMYVYSAVNGSIQNSAVGIVWPNANIVYQVIYVPNKDSFTMYGANQGDLTNARFATWSGTTPHGYNTSGTSNQFGLQIVRGGVSASGNFIGFTPTEMKEFTSTLPVEYSTYTLLGTVTGTRALTNAFRYLAFQHLPVNNRYAMVGFATSSPTQLYFYNSLVSAPAAFTETAITFGFGQSITQIYTASIFEDTNGDIYLSVFLLFPDSSTNSYTYRSTDGGASFTRTNAETVQGPMVITRNLL